MSIKKSINKKMLLFLTIVLVLFIIFILINNNKDSEKSPTEYKITEEYKEETAEDITTPVSPETITENENGDFDFARHMKEVYREYPWYRKFPIEKEDYLLIWVPQEKSFRIVMLIDQDSSDKEKNNIIDQALSDIEKATGVSYRNYPYYVVY